MLCVCSFPIQGDILQLQCFYGTEELSEVTLVSQTIFVNYRHTLNARYVHREVSALEMRCVSRSCSTIPNKTSLLHCQRLMKLN